MKRYERILLATCLAFSLAGCQTAIPGLQTVKEGPKATVSQKGSISLTIKWPEIRRTGYQAQALPSLSKAIRFTLQKDGQPVEERIVKKGEMQDRYEYNAPVSTIKFDLEPGTGYTLGLKVYNSELEEELIEANEIAHGTSPSFEVKSGFSSIVKISLAATNGAEFEALPFAGAANGYLLTLTGTNLGTNKDLIRAEYRSANGGVSTIPVEALEGNQLSVRLTNVSSGNGVLKVFVDGIGAPEIPLAIAGNLQIDQEWLNSHNYYSNGVNWSNCLVKGQPVTVPVQGTYWNNVNNVPVTLPPVKVTVLDDQNLPVSDAAVGNVVTLPNNGNYKIQASVGDLTSQQITCKAVSIALTQPNIPLKKMTKLNFLNYQTYPTQAEIDVPGTISDGTNEYTLHPNDYKWTFSVPNVAVCNNATDNWQTKATFGGGTTAGAVTVTATSKIDPTQSFTFQLHNVGVQSFDISSATLSIRRTETNREIRITRLRLTNGDILDLNTAFTSDINSNFTWTSGDPNLFTVAKKNFQSTWNGSIYVYSGNGTALISGTGLQSTLGSANLTVQIEGTQAKMDIPVEVTDDGAVELVIQ